MSEHDDHHHDHGHAHSHGNISGVKVFWVAVFNLIITLTEFVGGIISGSLALVSDAAHNLSDTASIILSYIGIKYSQKEKNEKKSFGYKRAEIIIAFINSATLIGICLYLLFEAYDRFLNPETINGNLMITIALIGLVANLISVFLLESDAHSSMNIKAAYLHLLGDTLSSVGVVAGGLAIKFWDLYWIDPLITVIVAVYIIYESWKIVKRSVDILMQSSADLDFEAIAKDIQAIPDVINIHHVHTWYSNERTIYFEAHVSVCDILISRTKPILEKIEHILTESYGISHITIQFEDDRSCPANKEIFSK
ncbi:MAG: cation diffusion facilitator family transporter [Candidatus Delongbacteria bacterium]|jgi:cobalt-zinc-cadmium efflux system protein|nr:cation diffusion facilitator family transporter [Candidatus Delongbacteria bacterium]MDD4204647.1 cation diffusion facilitator family transporter [Candidatus Delongbacteria bacterium]